AVLLARGVGLLEERDEIGLARALDDPADAIVVVDARFARDPSAVAPAGQHHARLVEIGPRRDPVEPGPDVLDRSLAVDPVVHLLELAAGAARAAHGGQETGAPARR